MYKEAEKMEELAMQYERQHAGHVTKISDYSFEFETPPDKNGNTKKYVIMKSYFLKLKNC